MHAHSYQQNWKEEPKFFNLMCVVRLLIKISSVAVTAAQFCVWCIMKRQMRQKQAVCVGWTVSRSHDRVRRMHVWIETRSRTFQCSIPAETFSRSFLDLVASFPGRSCLQLSLAVRKNGIIGANDSRRIRLFLSN